MNLPPDRRTATLVALLVVALGLLLRFPGAMPGPRVVSAMDHLSVHPLFQDAESADRGRVHHPHLSDPALQLAALDRRTVEALRTGKAPLWNPDLYGGAPLLADGQSRPLSPVTLLKAALPHHPGVASDLGVAWIFAWFTVGFTLLARRIGSIPLPALAVTAAAALTTPYLSVWLLHPHASTFTWLPWCLLAIESGSSIGVALTVVGLWTGGHPGTTLHVAAAGGLWWLGRSRQPGPVVGAAVGMLLAAPLWAPLWEQVARSTTATARVGGTLHASLLLDLLWPGFHGHPAGETWTGPGSWADGQLHPGLATLALGMWGAFGPGARRRLRTILFLWMGTATVASVLGLPGPVAHGRLASFMAVFWVLLAALGTAQLATRIPRGAWLLPVMVLLTGTWARRMDQHTLTSAEHGRSAAPWVDALVEAQGDGRIIGIGWAAQPNTGALAGLRDLRGYDLPISKPTHTLMGTLAQPPRGPWYPIDQVPDPAWLAWWDVRVVTAFPGAMDPSPLLRAGWLPISLPPGAPLQGWHAPDAGPSAWLVSATQVVSSAQQAQAGLSIDRAVAPVSSAGPHLERAAPIVPAARTWDGASRMVLEAPAQDHETLLVVAEAWAPGWRARLGDGTPVAPLMLGTLSLGVPIPPGTEQVELYYRPDGWIRGQQLAWVGLAGLLGMVWHRRRRKRNPPLHAPLPASGPARARNNS